MQHPMMRKVAEMFGIVTTVDGTHKTTKYADSTLLNSVCMDSFGKMACCGVLFTESESESSLEFVTAMWYLGNFENAHIR